MTCLANAFIIYLNVIPVLLNFFPLPRMIFDSKDGIIWDCIKDGACAFQRSSNHKVRYCNSPYNVAGICSQGFCPLANAQYATIKEENDRLYLIMKVIERQHQPADLWEHIELPLEYEESIRVIREHLRYFDKELQKKCILRLTKFTEEFQRRQKLGQKLKSRVAPIKNKQERRERIRQDKALRAAQIEKTVERELMRQLQRGKYNGIFAAARHVQPAIQDLEDVIYEKEEELNTQQEKQKV